jgi:hypothetical protein
MLAPNGCSLGLDFSTGRNISDEAFVELFVYIDPPSH